MLQLISFLHFIDEPCINFMHNAKMNMWILMYHRVLQLDLIRPEILCGFNRRRSGWGQVDPLLGWVRHRFFLGNYRIFLGSMVLIFYATPLDFVSLLYVRNH